MIPILSFLFGLRSLCMAFVHTFGQAIAVRFCASSPPSPPRTSIRPPDGALSPAQRSDASEVQYWALQKAGSAFCAAHSRAREQSQRVLGDHVRPPSVATWRGGALAARGFSVEQQKRGARPWTATTFCRLDAAGESGLVERGRPDLIPARAGERFAVHPRASQALSRQHRLARTVGGPSSTLQTKVLIMRCARERVAKGEKRPRTERKRAANARGDTEGCRRARWGGNGASEK